MRKQKMGNQQFSTVKIAVSIRDTHTHVYTHTFVCIHTHRYTQTQSTPISQPPAPSLARQRVHRDAAHAAPRVRSPHLPPQPPVSLQAKGERKLFYIPVYIASRSRPAGGRRGEESGRASNHQGVRPKPRPWFGGGGWGNGKSKQDSAPIPLEGKEQRAEPFSLREGVTVLNKGRMASSGCACANWVGRAEWLPLWRCGLFVFQLIRVPQARFPVREKEPDLNGKRSQNFPNRMASERASLQSF